MTLNQFFFPDIHIAPQDDSLTRMTTPCPHLHAVFTVYSSSSGIYKKKKKKLYDFGILPPFSFKLHRHKEHSFADIAL